MQYLHGVGGDNVGIETSPFKHESVRLSRFLESASQAIMILLDEDEERKYGSSRDAQDQKDVVFSEKVTLIDTDSIQCLAERRVKAMSFAPDQASLLAIAHGSTGDDFRSYVTVWNVGSPSTPLHMLVASNEVQVLTFSPSKASMVFAGKNRMFPILPPLAEIAKSEYRFLVASLFGESELASALTLPPEKRGTQKVLG